MNTVRRAHALNHMRIVGIRTRVLRYNYPPGLEISDARHTLTYREAVLVEVEGEDGQVGLGEAITIGGPPISTLTVIRDELAPRLTGRDPLDRERLWHDMYYGSFQHGRKGLLVVALSALDTAIWDLCARSLGIPLYQFIGGYHNRVPAYASGGVYVEGKGIDELVEEVFGYVTQGFKAVKIKVGRPPLREDIKRVKAVREAIGPNVLLMVDANRAYNHWEALQMGRELEKLNVRFFEEPLPADDLDGYRELGRKLDLTLAAGENEYTQFGFRDLLDTGAIGVAQPDLSWSGGVTACLKVASLCEARHIEVAPHAFTSIVNLAATLHLLGGIPNGTWLEWDQNPNGLRTGLGDYPLQLDEEGCVRIPDAPGTGLMLDPAAVERFTISV